MTQDTVIQCNSTLGIVLSNITNLMITNITVRNCSGGENNIATVSLRDCSKKIFITRVVLLMRQCTNVQLIMRHILIKVNNNSYGTVSINIFRNSCFLNITNNVFGIVYNDTKHTEYQHHSLSIDYYYNIIRNVTTTNIITFAQQHKS